ncbi:MAG: type II toxin-antitoxin system VapC family toxin [SAR202 cluster bacterium]|nr:type II toxin-antitoxin system VapC family toxin [SAR202 cluster bacterium]
MSGFLDTSALLRYLTGDLEPQARQAAALIESDEELLITSVVLAEAAYALNQFYGVERAKIVDYLVAFLQRANIETFDMDKSEALQGLMMCRPSGRVSFADALIWAAARSSPQNTVYSFDQAFPREGLEVRTPP